ncbi:MAG: lipocalin family protein [Maritimibacter sp.]
MRLTTFALIAATTLGLASPALAGYRDTSKPIGVVTNLNLQKYLGKWYEIARYPNWFEKNCEGVTAEYAMMDNGKVSVKNTCRKGAPDGPAKVALGEATPAAPGKLEVTFTPWLPFAKGDYWVMYVDPAYSFAVVGNPKGSTGWILARSKMLSAAQLAKAKSVLKDAGYDLSELEMVQH